MCSSGSTLGVRDNRASLGTGQDARPEIFAKGGSLGTICYIPFFPPPLQKTGLHWENIWLLCHQSLLQIGNCFAGSQQSATTKTRQATHPVLNQTVLLFYGLSPIWYSDKPRCGLVCYQAGDTLLKSMLLCSYQHDLTHMVTPAGMKWLLLNMVHVVQRNLTHTVCLSSCQQGQGYASGSRLMSRMSSISEMSEWPP